MTYSSRVLTTLPASQNLTPTTLVLKSIMSSRSPDACARAASARMAATVAADFAWAFAVKETMH